MSLSVWDTYIGVSGRLGDYRGTVIPGTVRVSYKDAEGIRRTVNICADGARQLARALRLNADVLDPPKPRKAARRDR